MTDGPFVPGCLRDTAIHMYTTLNIGGAVMQRLREEAPRRGTAMSALLEVGLRRVLAEPEATGEQTEDFRHCQRGTAVGS